MLLLGAQTLAGFGQTMVAGAMDRPDQCDALVTEARGLLERGDASKAEKQLQQCLATQPESSTALFLLGRVQQMQNHPRESLATLTRAAARSTPMGEDLRIAALDYVLLDDYADALRWSERAIQMSPNNAEAWYDLGRVQMHDGRFPEAMAALERSLTLHPESAKALDNLGICLENQDRVDEALIRYVSAVKATAASGRPTAQPYMDEGKLLVTRNAYADAVPLLLRATELSPKDSAAFAALASAYVGTKEIAAARTAIEQAVILDEQNPRLHYQLARIYRLAGEPELARREFQQSARLYGGHSAQ